MKLIKIILFLLMVTAAQSQTVRGGITGAVKNVDTKISIPLANIVIPGTTKGTTTDLDGNFIIENLEPGNYSLSISYIGYQKRIITDVIVRPGRNTQMDIEIKSVSLEMDSLVVFGGFFTKQDVVLGSVSEFSAEEIRRAPGSAGDVSRILFGLPSVAKVNDGKSSFLVRGGSALENIFYVDNIEIPNINHFAGHGSSDGLFGILNVDFVKNITFSPGGFPVTYGDKLSSVMDIQLRDGNREKAEGQIDIGYATAGGQAEGPLPGVDGSYFFGVKKSYLDLVMKTFAEGYPSPEFLDIQGKVRLQLSETNTLSLLGIYADDIYHIGKDKAIEKELNEYGKFDIRMFAGGINWMILWDTVGYTNTTISVNSAERKTALYKTQNGILNIKDGSSDYAAQVRTTNFRRISSTVNAEGGIEFKLNHENINMEFAPQTVAGGETLYPRVKKSISQYSIAPFLTTGLNLGNGITMNLGLRGTWSESRKEIKVFPRAGVQVKINPLLSVGISAGKYGQSLPLFLLAQNNDFKKLPEPEVMQYSLLTEYFLAEDTRMTIDIYNKKYRNSPVSAEHPGELVFDEAQTEGMFRFHSQLFSTGKADSRGVEAIIQKKLKEKIYGMASISYSKNTYRGYDGVRRNRVTDNKFNFAVEGGYKPDDEWEFSLRWIYAGGAPYTPFDIAASTAANNPVKDESMINEARLPDYHALNLRVDKRFYFERSNMVVYFSIWNAYNRKNISSYSWNEFKNQSRPEAGWDLLPLMGIEYEF